MTVCCEMENGQIVHCVDEVRVEFQRAHERKPRLGVHALEDIATP